MLNHDIQLITGGPQTIFKLAWGRARGECNWIDYIYIYLYRTDLFDCACCVVFKIIRIVAKCDLVVCYMIITHRCNYVAMQFHGNDYSILADAQKQSLRNRAYILSPSAPSLNLKAKHQLACHTRHECEDHLQTLTVQSKFENSSELESSCRTFLWQVFILGNYHST